MQSVYLPVNLNPFVYFRNIFLEKNISAFSESNLLKWSHRNTDNDCHHISHHITPGKHDSEEMPQISISWVKSSPVCNCNVPLQRVRQESWCRGEISLKYQLKELREMWPSLRWVTSPFPKWSVLKISSLPFSHGSELLYQHHYFGY